MKASEISGSAGASSAAAGSERTDEANDGALILLRQIMDLAEAFPEAPGFGVGVDALDLRRPESEQLVG